MTVRVMPEGDPHESGNSIFAIGVDVGGTKIAGAVVDVTSGELFCTEQAPTAIELGGEAILSQVEAMVRRLIMQADGRRLIAIGLGVPELVSPEGVIFSGYRIAWNGLSLHERLSSTLPLRIESDVRAASLAEARLGAGRGRRDFIYLSIGTGISAVFIRDGRPHHGARGAAVVLANGRTRHVCGVCGAETAYVLESAASGPAVAEAYCGRKDAGAEAVVAAARQGDRRALAVLDLAAQRIGQALGPVIGVLDPEAVVVGGGLGSAPGPFFDAVVRETRAALWDDGGAPIPIVPAAMGAASGVVGAAITAAEWLEDPAQDGTVRNQDDREERP